MQEIVIDSWKEFQKAIDQIANEYGEREIAGIKEKNRIFYRGQTDSEWPLVTTLDRFSSYSWTVASYIRLALRCAPQIESFTDQSWNFPSYEKIENEIKKNSGPFCVQLPCYDFLVYLRHHGFPSPLLDWTASPYIAAFFAFVEQSNASNAAIFAYTEMPKGIKSGFGGPEISVLGPYVKTHRRHFLQQSCYTICVKDETMKDEIRYDKFASHEDVFCRGIAEQDVLIKIIIPRTKRLKILSYLNELNINYFSLFQSEDALIKTLAFKEIEMKNI